MIKKNRVLITGVNGFIGRNLSDHIKMEHAEWDIYGIDRKGDGTKYFYQIDIKCEKKLKKFLIRVKPRYIFHLAGEASFGDFERLLLSNVFSTFVLFKVIKEIKGYKPRIIIPSSAAECGTASQGRVPESLYGFSKMVQTDLSLFFARQGLDVVVGRIFNIMGEGVPASFSIGRFAYELALIKKKKKLAQLNTKSLDMKRDFLDIHDICAYLWVLAANGKSGEIYNLCRGRSCVIRSLLSKIISISGLKNVKINIDTCTDGERSRGDSFGSAKKIRSIAKGIKLVSIDRSLKETYKYYLNRV